MTVAFILTLSIILQFGAAIMAFRLIPLTGRRLAWSLISAALMLMALRRCITLIHSLSGETIIRPDLNAELIALAISLIMAVGISMIAPIFIDRKRAEEALQESEERYRKVADFTYAWEYWLAPDGKYLYISPACERISGYRVEEFHQDPNLLEKIIHPDDKHRLAVHIHDVLQGKSDACELEFRIITRNNEECWIGHECQGVYGRDGAYLGRRGSNRDITDRKRIQEALKEKDKFTKSIVQSSAVATFVVNMEHKVIYWNRACEDLTGIKSEDLLGTSDHWKAFYDHRRPCVADVIIDNKFNEMTNLYKVYARSVLIPDGMRAEGWYPNLGGKNRYIVFDAAPIRDDNGKITAAIETLQDITERKQAEDAQQEGQRQLNVNGLYEVSHFRS
ncbi:MAG: PAS domain-containing protein [Deltaproteobacteria bacterium]